jgi:GR25 family glycosyltransferase involved in LPS biosynthesis
MSQSPVFVVSLSRATARQDTFSAGAAEANITFSFFEAIDSESEDLPSLLALAGIEADGIPKMMNRPPVSTPELACALSHRAVWKRILETDAPGAFILEDDVQLKSNTRRVFWSINSVGETWRHRNAVIYFTSGGHKRNWIEQHVLGELSKIRLGSCGLLRRIRRLRGPLWGTSGYYLTRAGAKSLIEHEESRVMRADAWYERVQAGYLKEVWLVDPPCIVHPDDRSDSYIEKSRRMLEKEAVPASQWQELSRAAFVKTLGVFRRVILDPFLRLFG